MDYISKIEGHPLKADGLTESPRLLDKEPYLFRPSYSNGYAYETLIGGTCGVNQLVQNSGISFTSTSTDTRDIFALRIREISAPYTFLFLENLNAPKHIQTIVNATASFTGLMLYHDGSQSNIIGYSDNAFNVISGHKYLLNIDVTGADVSTVGGVSYDDFNLIDLTAMFGSTIADYIYSLEQATAGAGVAWFKALFPNGYYAHNAGELISVKTSAHITIGFNQFDKSTATLDKVISTNGAEAVYSNFAHSDYIRALPNTVYYVSNTDASTDVSIFANYNLSKEFIGFSGGYNGNQKLRQTLPNTAYIIVNMKKSVINDICINISDANKNGTYQPYVSHEYPLDDIELRGILKLDSNNNLYYDGDTYESNGSVTRKYGIVDLGNLEYTYNSTRNYFTATVSGIKRPTASSDIPNLLSDIYTAKDASSVVIGTSGDMCIAVSSAYDTIMVVNQSYTDSATFKTAMSGKYLVYELATPTTETADAFTNPMVVDGNGTEEFVDGRTVEMPVGHSTIYVDNSDKTKLDNLPDISNDGDGTYVINQENGKQSLITPNATDISYSNTSSGLTATKVQGAIDEVNTKVGTKANSSDVYTKSNTYNKTEVNSMLTLVKTANGTPCTFDTDLSDNLVSLTAEIVASGGGGTPSTPIPIVGYSSANITRCGVNLWDEEWELGGINYFNGQEIESNSDLRSKNYCAIPSNATLYLYANGMKIGANWKIILYDKNKNYLDYWGFDPNGRTLDTTNACFFKICLKNTTTYNNDISINYPSTDHNYHAYNGQTYTIAFGQTVYGGVLDVTRGKLHVTWSNAVDLGSLAWSYESGLDIFVSTNFVGYKNGTPFLCDVYSDNGEVSVTQLTNYGGTLRANALYIKNTDYTDVPTFKTAMSGKYITAELATPIDIDLTPVQISALVGTNNITSDLGGDVKVRYMAGEVASQVADIVKTELPDEPKYVLNKERIVGYWIDGKPIYEKLLSQTFSSGSDVVAIGLPYRTYAVLDAWGFLMYQDLSNSVLINGCLDATQSVYAIFNRAENDGILIKRESSSMGGSTPTVYVTIRYIKS